MSPSAHIEQGRFVGRRGRLLAAVLIGFVLLGLTLGCGKGKATQQTQQGVAAAQRATTLIVAIPGTPPSLDYEFTSGELMWLIGGQVDETGAHFGQVAYPYKAPSIADPRKMPGFTFPDLNLAHAKPGIIQRCVLSSNGKTGTYYLRHGVMSAYGHKFTSADVLWRNARSIALKGNGYFNLTFQNTATAAWKALGKYTVQVKSKVPMPLFCTFNVHQFSGFPDSTEAKKHATASDPWAKSWMQTRWASFGPYYVTDWKPGKQVVEKANSHYWQGDPSIKKIIFTVVPDASARLSLLEAGKVDVATNLLPDSISSLATQPHAKAISWRTPTMLFAVINNKKYPLKVRQALNTAIPRGAIASQIYKGMAAPFQGPTPSIYPTLFVNRTTYTYNLAKAKALLKQAGYAGGLKMTLSYSSSDPALESVALLLRDTYAKIGVSLTLTKLPYPTVTSLVFSEKADFILWEDSAYLPEGVFTSEIFYHMVNHSQYNNRKVFAAIEAGKTIVDATKRAAYYRRVQTQIYNDSPYLWLVEPENVIGVSDRVRGLHPVDAFPRFGVYGASLSD